MAPTMTSADTPITAYSSHGVPEVGRVTVMFAAEVDQGDDGGHRRPERGQPEHRAHGDQDAVDVLASLDVGSSRERAAAPVLYVISSLSVRSCRYCEDDTLPSLVVIEQFSLLDQKQAGRLHRADLGHRDRRHRQRPRDVDVPLGALRPEASM